MAANADMLRGNSHQESRNDDVDGLGEDLLADAECGPRVELMLVEVVGLLELEELLGLPAQPVEFGDLSSSGVGTAQGGEVERLLAAAIGQLDRANFDRLSAIPCILRRRNQHALIVPSTRAERVDGLESVRGRDRSEEHTSELQSRENLVCRLLLEKKKKMEEKQ